MWLIVGLGNPGAAYARSRHNVGFLVVDEFARRRNQSLKRRRWESQFTEVTLGGEPIIVIKPLCFMNNSGSAVKAWLEKRSVLPARLVVIHDDLDLAFGRIKVLARGGHGGHQGVRSIQEALETIAFPRVRVGIGRPDEGDEVTFVLGSFDAEEAPVLPELVRGAADAVEEIVEKGVASAMNRFNVRVRARARGRQAVVRSPKEVDECQSTN